MIVEKLCELQSIIDEYERFHGDLFIMLAKRRTGQIFLKHKVPGDNFMEFIWDKCERLIEENEELKAKTAQDLQEK